MKHEMVWTRRQVITAVGVAAFGQLFCGHAAYAAAPGLKKRVLSADEVTLVGHGVVAPEGPAVLPNGHVAMVEFDQGNVVVLDKAGNMRVLAHVGSGVAGTILGDDGALYVAKSDLGAFLRNMPPPGGGGGPSPGGGGPPPPGGGGMINDGTPAAIWRIDLTTEAAAVLYDKENGEPLAGPNDLAKDKWGDLWVSQPADASVLNLKTDGSHMSTVLTGVRGVNGITFSPDKAELYVMSDGKLMGFEVAERGKLVSENGTPRGRVLLAWPAELGTPDGMKTQENGNILCACKDFGIVEVSPQGELLTQTVLEGQQIVNIAFSPLEPNVLFLAVHPSDNMTGGLVKVDWPASGAF